MGEIAGNRHGQAVLPLLACIRIDIGDHWRAWSHGERARQGHGIRHGNQADIVISDNIEVKRRIEVSHGQ